MPRARIIGGNHERRRRQNAEAQRTYRAKQKERFRVLEQMVVSVLASSNDQSAGQNCTGTETKCIRLPAGHSQTLTADTRVKPARNSASSVLPLLLSFHLYEYERCLPIMAREGFGLRDLVKYGLICLGRGMDPYIFDLALLLPAYRWIELVQLTYIDVDITQIVTCGFRVLAELKNPPDWPSLESFRTPYPNISTGQITFTTISTLSAQLLIAQQLGLSPESMLDDDAQSPFCMSHKKGQRQNPASRHKNIAHITIDLVPTTVQRTTPHHPHIDLLPWPSFRSKVISAASVVPPAIDEDEFCLDILNGGLRCWGSTLGSSHGRGEGVPWDSRSWEAMPWFLEKWQGLVGDEDSEISRTSAWWRNTRGAEISKVNSQI